MKQRLLGILFAMISAVIFGIMPWLTTTLYQMGGNAISIPFYRDLIVALLLAGIILHQSLSFRVDRRSILPLLGGAVFGMGLTPVFLYLSYYRIPSGMATTIHFSYPIIVFVMIAALLRRRIIRSKLVALLMSTIGLFLLFDLSGTIDLAGVLICFASAVTYAIYIVIVGHSAVKHEHPIVIAFYYNLLAFLFIGCIGLISQSLTINYTAATWGMMVLFALVVGIGGSIFFQLAVGYIGSQSASILSTLEPITSIVIGLVVLGEVLAVKTAVGMALVLISSLIIIVRTSKEAACEDA